MCRDRRGPDLDPIPQPTPRDDAGLRERLRALASERRRFGYRRLHVLLRREGHVVNCKKTQRLYREEGLSVRDGGKKGDGDTGAAADSGRRRFRIFNVIDDVTKECLAAVVDTSISGRRVARELTALIARRGRPGLIVSDHGTEFTSNAMLAWSEETGVPWHFIAPGKRMQNGICDLPTRPAARQRQPHRFTPKLRRRSVPVSHRTPPGSSVGALHIFRASPPSPPGWPTTTLQGPILRSATRPPRPTPPNSPQGSIGSTKRRRSADRPLLPPRKRAIVTRRLWFSWMSAGGQSKGDPK